MKKKVFLIAALVILLISCGKMYEYKYLDGMWQIRFIEYADGEREHPEQVYYSFQFHKIQIQKINNGAYYGSFTYVGDSLYTKFSKEIPVERLKTYGMDGHEQSFYVEELTSSKLILKSNYSNIEFRKY